MVSIPPTCGTIVCGECGGQITASEKEKRQKNGNVHHYIFYHCTKRKAIKCRQRYVREHLLDEQIINDLNKISIPPEFYEVAMQWFRERNVEESRSRGDVLESQQRAYNLCLKKIDGLIDMRAAGEITDEEFKAKKSVVLEEKEKYQGLLGGTDKRADHWLELAEDVFTFARDVKLRFETGDWDTKKQILQMLGSRFILKDKKLEITLDELLFGVPTIAKEAKKQNDRLEPPGSVDTTGKNGDLRPISPTLLRGQDSDLLRELMGLPGKPFPTLPRYFSQRYGENAARFVPRTIYEMFSYCTPRNAKLSKEKIGAMMNDMRDEDIKKLFAGKKITLMGLGLLGRGIGDAEFLASAGAELIVTDLKNGEELAPSVVRLKNFPNIAYHLGGHRMEDFENRDIILRAPNAPFDSPFIAHARERGIPIEMDASLFAKLSSATVVGITGTRGKSTVTHLIYEMAKMAHLNPLLGGNERDTSTLQLLPEADKGGLVILELDSWQLQGFEESKISPHVAVWTNLMPDHMNYYHGDMERYFRDKAAIARFQKPGDFFVTTPEIKEKIELTFGKLQGTYITDNTLPDSWTIALPGEHNRQNAGYAAAVTKILGVTENVIKNVLKNFSGLPGRFEFLGERGGIGFYNDGNSTTPEAAIAALHALAAIGRPIVLIAGGNDKEMQFEAFAHEIVKNVKKVVLFTGTATEKLRARLPKEFPTEIVSGMDEAFSSALAAAKKGDVILLSPGATSFGIFKNEYDRGDQFVACVNALKK